MTDGGREPLLRPTVIWHQLAVTRQPFTVNLSNGTVKLKQSLEENSPKIFVFDNNPYI